MRLSMFALAVLLVAPPLHAWPIGLGSKHCVCALVPEDAPVNPGWDPSLTLEQIAELQRLDDLHEPPAGSLPAMTHLLVCVDEPRIPPGMGGGGAGGPGGGGETPGTVPEPALLQLLAAAAVAAGLRRARRRR